MARPPSITNEQILEAARKCFLEQGYGVSTVAIAREAGISEGTIFRRFPTKEELFLAAMGLPGFEHGRTIGQRVGAGEVHTQLREIGLELLAFFRLLVPRMTLLCSHKSFDPISHFKGRPDAPPIVLLRALAQYFEGEMALGRLRRADPQVAARLLIGSLHHFVFLELIGAAESMPASPAFVDGVVDTLLEGLRPRA